MSKVQNSTGDWTQWGVRVLEIGYKGYDSDFLTAYCISTNTLKQVEANSIFSGTNEISNFVLSKYDMDNLTVCEAFSVLSGVNAAFLGWKDIALSYTNQISADEYFEIIEEILE